MNWQHNGVAGDLDPNTPQTPGMTRAAAITHARTGASKLWAGTVVVQPNAKTGPRHHGQLETVLYIVRGRARIRWGDLPARTRLGPLRDPCAHRRGLHGRGVERGGRRSAALA